MKKARFAGMQDYLALLVRSRWVVIIAFIALTALAVLLSSRLPKIYISQAMLQVQQRDVPSDFVKDLISGSTEQRLSAIELTILSRTNLLKILREFETEMPDYRGLNNDLKVEKIKKAIQIEFPTEKVRGQWLPLTNVQIAYRDRNPELAQKIAARLASLFVEHESRAREEQVFGTTEFLTAELNKVSQQLQESESRLKTMKERYRYQLPSELETNLRTLDRLQTQKTSNIEAIDRYMTMRLNLEQQIAETPATIRQEVAARQSGSSAVPVSPRTKALEAIQAKEQEYNQLLARNTEKHPDVQRLKVEIEQMKKDLPPEDTTVAETPAAEQSGPGMVANPLYQSLNNQLRQINTEIEIREREKNNIEAQMTRYTQLVTAAPRVEQEIAGIMRTNSDLTKQYDDLKNKLSQASLSESLESRQKGTQFLLVDQANYPLEPATPRRRIVLIYGLLISLALSLAVAFGVGLADQRIWTQQELERYLGAPVLVEIPSIVTPTDIKRERQKKLMYAGVIAVCLGIYLGGVGYAYLKQPQFLRAVDPLMEKITERMVSQ